MGGADEPVGYQETGIRGPVPAGPHFPAAGIGDGDIQVPVSAAGFYKVPGVPAPVLPEKPSQHHKAVHAVQPQDQLDTAGDPEAQALFSHEYGFFNTDKSGIMGCNKDYNGAWIDYWAGLQKSKLSQEREGFTSILDPFSRG